MRIADAIPQEAEPTIWAATSAVGFSKQEAQNGAELRHIHSRSPRSSLVAPRCHVRAASSVYRIGYFLGRSSVFLLLAVISPLWGACARPIHLWQRWGLSPFALWCHCSSHHDVT